MALPAPYISALQTTISTSAGNLSVNAPAGIQPGDLLIVMVSAGYESITSVTMFPDIPSGWRRITTSGNSAADCYNVIFWRRARYGEPTSVTVNSPFTTEKLGFFLVIKNGQALVDSNFGPLVNFISGVDSGADATALIAASLVLSEPTLVVVINTVNKLNGNSGLTVASGWTEEANESTSTSNTGIASIVSSRAYTGNTGEISNAITVANNASAGTGIGFKHGRPRKLVTS